MKLVNRIIRRSGEDRVPFMDALRNMIKDGECTAEEAKKELVSFGVIDEDDVEDLRELQGWVEAWKADTEFEACFRSSPYDDHPMGIFAGVEDLDDAGGFSAELDEFFESLEDMHGREDLPERKPTDSSNVA